MSAAFGTQTCSVTFVDFVIFEFIIPLGDFEYSLRKKGSFYKCLKITISYNNIEHKEQNLYM